MSLERAHRAVAFRVDLLATRAGRWLVTRGWLPIGLQALALLGVVALAVNGWGVGAGEPGERLLVLRKTNLTTLLVWGLWWPAMIAGALALGRAWCAVCPMELVNRAGAAVARRAGLKPFNLPRWMRAGWAVVGAYLFLQVLVAVASIHRVPHYTSLMIALVSLLALVSGLLLSERSFCKAFCPAGALLSAYGRHTPVQLDVRDAGVCASCRTKDCVRASNRDRFEARSCPSLIQPYGRSPSDGCVLCFQCAKVCPHQNVGFGVVRAEASVRRRAPLLPAEAAFVMVATGFVSHEIIGEVKWLEGLFHKVPEVLHRLVPAVPFDAFEAAWFLLLVPALLWALIALVGWTAGHRQGLRSLLLAAAAGAAPVVAVAHLGKALAKVASWGGYLPLALHEPAGTATMQALVSKALPTPAALAQLSVTGTAMLVLLGLVAVRAWRWLSDSAPAERAAARAGAVVTCLAYASVFVVWAGGF